MTLVQKIIAGVQDNLKLGDYDDELEMYTSAEFTYNGTHYFIDGTSWDMYRIVKGEYIPVHFTVSIDKKEYMVTAFGGSPVKVHRLLALMLLCGCDYTYTNSSVYHVNHIWIPSDYYEAHIVKWLNHPAFLEILTPSQNKEHMKFVHMYKLQDCPVCYKDIPLLKELIKKHNVPIGYCNSFIKNAYIKRKEGVAEYMGLKNIFKYINK